MAIPGADSCTLFGVGLDLEPIPPFNLGLQPVGKCRRTLDQTYIIQVRGSHKRWNCTLTYVTDATKAALEAAVAVGDTGIYSGPDGSGTFYCESFGPPSRNPGEDWWSINMTLLKVE